MTWDFGGGVRSTAALTGAPAVNPTFSTTDANGDQLYNASARAYLVVPPPGTPTVVGAVQVGDQFQVSWTTPLANPLVITSSTITATPVNSLGADAHRDGQRRGHDGADRTAAALNELSDHRRHHGRRRLERAVERVSRLVPGSLDCSRPHRPASRRTGPRPALPGDLLVVTWAAAAPGDSPIDQYKITITGSDGGGTFTQTVSGATLTASFSVSDNPDWTITVQAHNAVGWGPASTRIVLGGA